MVPLEIATDFGSQFFVDILTHFHLETWNKHNAMIPYSKEENEIVKRTKKTVPTHTEHFFRQRSFKELVPADLYDVT